MSVGKVINTTEHKENVENYGYAKFLICFSVCYYQGWSREDEGDNSAHSTADREGLQAPIDSCTDAGHCAQQTLQAVSHRHIRVTLFVVIY